MISSRLFPRSRRRLITSRNYVFRFFLVGYSSFRARLVLVLEEWSWSTVVVVVVVV